MEWPFVILFVILGLFAAVIKIATLGYFQTDDNPYSKDSPKSDDEEKPPRA
jgi:F0F1-type ATP synthase assembly protein I